MTRKKKLQKAFNIKRNNIAKRTKIVGGELFARDHGLGFLTVTAQNAGQFIGFMKTYHGNK